jgi:hypothetical protein
MAGIKSDMIPLQLVRALDGLATVEPKDFHPKSEGKVRGWEQGLCTDAEAAPASGAGPHSPISMYVPCSLKQLVLTDIRSLHGRRHPPPAIRVPAADGKRVVQDRD